MINAFCAISIYLSMHFGLFSSLPPLLSILIILVRLRKAAAFSTLPFKSDQTFAVEASYEISDFYVDFLNQSTIEISWMQPKAHFDNLLLGYLITEDSRNASFRLSNMTTSFVLNKLEPGCTVRITLSVILNSSVVANASITSVLSRISFRLF